MQAVASSLVAFGCLGNIVSVAMLQSGEVSTKMIQGAFLVSVLIEGGLVHCGFARAAVCGFHWLLGAVGVLMCASESAEELLLLEYPFAVLYVKLCTGAAFTFVATFGLISSIPLMALKVVV